MNKKIILILPLFLYSLLGCEKKDFTDSHSNTPSIETESNSETLSIDTSDTESTSETDKTTSTDIVLPPI